MTGIEYYRKIDFKKEKVFMITGNTGLYGVIGSPIRHSKSPAIYNFCFDYHGLDNVYLAFEVTEGSCEEFFRSAKTLGIKGFNVTMPCKEIAAKLCDKLSPAAEFARAANTIVNLDGEFFGHNTDGKGVVNDLKDHGVDVKDKKILLFGAGGAARAIMIQCALDGARTINVFNRNEEKLSVLKEISQEMKAKGNTTEFGFFPTGDVNALADEISDSDIVINATSLGMEPKPDTAVITDPCLLNADQTVYDVVYNPPVTRFMETANTAGCKVIGGGGMLIYQAMEAFKIYTGIDMDVKLVKAHMERISQ